MIATIRNRSHPVVSIAICVNSSNSIVSIEAVGLVNRETRYHSLRIKAVKVTDYFLCDSTWDT